MQLEIGQVVDGYLIQGVIGRGGMGIVYRAEDVALSRVVALKVINPSMSRDEAFVRRFQSEARTLAVINSPNIVAIHALRKTDKGLFIVMEYVDGGDLSEQMKAGKLSIGKTIPIIAQLLHAFQVAHSAGVVHRDIKPPNIMISNSGEVKITDFGLAKMNQAGITKSMTQGVIGTLYYMSPEQIKGEEVDQRSDIWALGVVFYEMLTGVRPFEAPYEASVMYAIINEPVVFPDRVQTDIPMDVQRVILRALEKDRDKRYQDATEMLVELEELKYSSVDMAATRVMQSPTQAGVKTSSRSRTGAHGSRSSSGVRDTGGKKISKPAPRVFESVSRKIPQFVAGGLGLFALIALVVYYTYGTSESVLPSTISLNSEPDNASVYIGGNFIGKTPVSDYSVENGGDSVFVRVESPGWIALDTLLKSRVMHFVELIKTSSESRDVSDDGQVNPSSEVERSRDETPRQAQVVNGALILQAFPGGTVFIDGARVESQTPVSLPPGNHTVRFESREYGTAEKTVRINARDNKNVNVYFESEVTISTRPSSIVFINDQLVGETPYVGTLGPGSYRIRVEKSGFISSPADTLITVKAAFDDPIRNKLRFTLQQQ